MAREFLGNIQGGFNGESIGVLNKLDMTKPKRLSSEDTWEFDVETGVVNYNLATDKFMSFDVELEPKIHTFRIEDFTVNTNYSGEFRFQLRDSNRDYIHVTNVPKKGHYTFDLSSYGSVDEYEVYFYREAGTGFFEKPMLVEGEYSVLWNHKTNFKNDVITGRFYKSEITNDNSYQNLSIFNFSDSPDVKVNGSGLEFEEGIYMFTNAMSIEQDEGIMNLNFRLNGSSELIENFEVVNTHSTAHILKVKKGDIFDLRVSYNGSVPGTQQVNKRNGFTITKLR